MKAVQDLKLLEDSILEITNDLRKRRPHGQDLRYYLINMTKEGQPLYGCETRLIHQFVDAYVFARHEPIPSFDEKHYKQYIELLNRLRGHVLKNKKGHYQTHPSHQSPGNPGGTPQQDPLKTAQVNINGKTTLRIFNNDGPVNANGANVDNSETSL